MIHAKPTLRIRLSLGAAAAALLVAAPLGPLAAPLSDAPLSAAPFDRTQPGAVQLAYDAQVQRVQRGLNRLGYDAGPADGLMGSKTRSAIEEYQRDHGLLVTGQASSSLAEHIRDQVAGERQTETQAPQPAAADVDRQAVLQLQSDLRKLGYSVPVVSGRVDAATAEAIRAYQRENDLLVDGRLTPELAAHVRGRTSAGVASEDRETVRSVQQALNERGYEAGPADGVMGSGTRDAIRTFQSDAGLPLTGRVTPELLSALGVAAAAGTAAATSGTDAEASGTDDPVTVISDSFQDGNYTRDPRWEVAAGSWQVTDGGALTSSVAVQQQGTSPKQLGKDLVQGILGNALGVQTQGASQNLAAIHARAATSNAFHVTLRLSAAGSPAVLNLGPYQGNNVGHGYRLEARSGDEQPLQLLATTAQGSTVIGSGSSPVRFDDGAKHEIDWRRDPNGLQTVELDGEVVLQVLDSSFKDPFAGLSLVNAGGTWSIDSVEVQSLEP